MSVYLNIWDKTIFLRLTYFRCIGVQKIVGVTFQHTVCTGLGNLSAFKIKSIDSGIKLKYAHNMELIYVLRQGSPACGLRPTIGPSPNCHWTTWVAAQCMRACAAPLAHSHKRGNSWPHLATVIGIWGPHVSLVAGACASLIAGTCGHTRVSLFSSACGLTHMSQAHRCAYVCTYAPAPPTKIIPSFPPPALGRQPRKVRELCSKVLVKTGTTLEINYFFSKLGIQLRWICPFQTSQYSEEYLLHPGLFPIQP